MTDVILQLPSSWARVRLDEIAEINPRLKADGLPEDVEVSFVPMKAVEELSGIVDLSESRRLNEVRKGYTYFADGDVLFAKITPCMENGKIAVAHDLKNGIGFGSTEFHVIRPDNSLLAELLFFYLTQAGFRKDAQHKMTGSAGQKRVPTGYMEAIQFPLPPLPEQRRIVAKIEELFSELDAGVASLETAKKQLARYRQSVLKAAVEGKLTAAWRKQHAKDIEPASELLKRILKERREKWEAEQLAQYEAKGKKPPKNWQAKYKEPEPPDTSDLPDLPEGWTWASLPLLGELNRGKSKHRPRNDPKLYDGLYPFIQTGEVRKANGYIREYTRTYNALGLKQSRLWPKGTLCITIAANIADTGILEFDACFPDSVVGFLPDKHHCNVIFVELFLRTAKEHLERFAPATAQKNINLEILNQVAVPVPPLEEQDAIVAEADHLLSLADDAERTIEQELKRADRLRQSILTKAFEGKLVPQDPSDEPAAELLKRIREMKHVHGNGRGLHRQKTKGRAVLSLIE